MAQGTHDGAAAQLYKIMDILPKPTRRLPVVEETVQEKIAKIISENAFTLKPIEHEKQIMPFCKTMTCDIMLFNKCCYVCLHFKECKFKCLNNPEKCNVNCAERKGMNEKVKSYRNRVLGV